MSGAAAPMRSILSGLAAALVCWPLAVEAAGEAAPPIDVAWPHDGIFGSFDRAAVQRGFQVYENVCSSCHGMKFLAFRNLEAIGYTSEQVTAIAEQYEVEDGPNDSGEMYMRPARPADHFPSPFPNEQAARAANGGALPPDLSVITKARAGGPDYIYSLLVGYEESPPDDVDLAPGMYYNEYFSGNAIAMAPPLFEGGVQYQDGTEASVDQMARDVTQFLHWVAEPKLEERKQTGIKVFLFLIGLTGLFYAYKRKLWSRIH